MSHAADSLSIASGISATEKKVFWFSSRREGIFVSMNLLFETMQMCTHDVKKPLGKVQA